MDSLPIELIGLFYDHLSSATDKLNFALVCRKFLLASLGSRFPSRKSLRLLVSSCPCHAIVSHSETCISVCQCPIHGSVPILEHILPFISRDLETLELEDELARDGIRDESLHSVLAHCADAPLTRLILSRCDLRDVRPWTVSMLAHFVKLQEVSFDGCILPISEAQFIRSLAGSFDTLTTFEVTDSHLITDKLAQSLARSCPHLEKLSVSGCKAVSSLTALALIETALIRRHAMLTLHLQNTSFDSALLDRYMRSPLFVCRNDWRLRPATIDIGYEKQAILAEQRQGRCVLMYV